MTATAEESGDTIHTSDPSNTVNQNAIKPVKEPSVWTIIAPVNREIRIAMVLSALSVVCWFTSIMLFWPIGTELMSDDRDTSRIWLIFACSIGAVIGAFVLRVVSFQISHIASFKLEQILRDELSTHLAKVPLGYVINAGSGSLKKILLDDVRSLHAFVADSTPLFSRAFCTPVLGLILLFIVDWRLALAAMALLPIGFIGMTLAFRDYDEIRRKVDVANEKMNSIIVEYVQGMQVVRTFDDGSASFRRYRAALKHSSEVLREWTGKTQTSAYVARLLFAALPTMMIVLAVGTWLYRQGTLTLPELMMGLALAPTITESIIPLVWLQQFIVNASAAVKRIHALRQVPVLPEVEKGEMPRDASLELEDVSFRYESREDYALTNVSFTVKPGTVTALVGPSGSGKSTVAQLLLRFWDAESGSVRVGGIDVRKMTADDLMRHVGFVFQSPFLLHDTVAENIRLGKPEATDDEVQEAACAAQAHDFILEELPDGYETVVGERGSALSGGQRQRITIARAMLQDCPIVVLDEATAFADPDNEAKIHQALAELTQGKTLLVVAHRLSTIQDAHQIVVLDAGRVAEVGTHDSLVTADGVYARLWRNFETAQGWGLRRADRVSATESTETE